LQNNKNRFSVFAPFQNKSPQKTTTNSAMIADF